jgi:uncharacterized protein YifE (UPF0438 family)
VANVTIFSQEETELLSRYGFWLEALAQGDVQPLTPAQQRFVEVHKGEAEPESTFERAWWKLLKRREIEPDLTPDYVVYDAGEAWFDRRAHWRYH